MLILERALMLRAERRFVPPFHLYQKGAFHFQVLKCLQIKDTSGFHFHLLKRKAYSYLPTAGSSKHNGLTSYSGSAGSVSMYLEVK